MSKVVAVSFEDEAIKVVYASVKGRDVSVADVLTLQDAEFDDFLAREKTKEFIVVCSFRDFFQETILIPSTKDRFVKKLVEAEITKNAPFKNFSFICKVSADKVVENRRVKEVIAFAVSNDEIVRIADRFIRKGKIVKAIYPDMFAMASSLDSKDMAVLCVSEVGLSKHLFLVKDGLIHFVRTAQSFEYGLADLDIQNINMTVNYCRQTLRIDPSFIMLTENLCDNYKAASETIIPLTCFAQQSLALKNLKTSVEAKALQVSFISPVSAFFVRDAWINLLTKAYKDFFMLQKALVYCTFVFIVLSAIGLGYAGYKTKNIMALNDRLGAIREGLPPVEAELAAYEAKKSALASYLPFIKSVNDAAVTPDYHSFLSLLAGLRMGDVRMDSITITAGAGENILDISFKGGVKAESYTEAQRLYQNFVNAAAGLKDVSIKGQGFALGNKTFHAELEWSPGAVPAPQKESSR